MNKGASTFNGSRTRFSPLIESWAAFEAGRSQVHSWRQVNSTRPAFRPASTYSAGISIEDWASVNWLMSCTTGSGQPAQTSPSATETAPSLATAGSGEGAVGSGWKANSGVGANTVSPERAGSRRGAGLSGAN